MPLSQDFRRCALATLLPLFMRSTNASELAISFISVVIVTGILVCFDNKVLYRDLIPPILIATTWSLLASYLADYLFVGAWIRFLFTYIIALDGTRDLWPEAFTPELEPELSTCIRSYALNANQLPDTIAPAMLASIITCGFRPYYNAQNRAKLVFCDALTWCIIVALCLKLGALILRWHDGIQTFAKRDDKEKPAADKAISKHNVTNILDQGPDTERKYIPKIIVTDSDTEAGNSEPSSPMEKRPGVKGVGKSVQMRFDVKKLCPPSAQEKTQQQKKEKKGKDVDYGDGQRAIEEYIFGNTQT